MFPLPLLFCLLSCPSVRYGCGIGIYMCIISYVWWHNPPSTQQWCPANAHQCDNAIPIPCPSVCVVFQFKQQQ
jgi:disulfide bond formation protein DsbB